jgi:calcineurin-like phosphoesterase family protein
MNYYISDLHFGHANVMKYDKRPFASIEEMDAEIIRRWNSVVTDKDTVYILGDISWYPNAETIAIFKQLKGHKILIKGNHDGNRLCRDKDFAKLFSKITDYEEITETRGGQPTLLVLSHYPIMFFKCQHRGAIHFYGHVHNSSDYDLVKKFQKEFEESYKAKGEDPNCCQMYNVGCMMDYMDYTPRTFEEIINAKIS